jgi:hypothetical protein
MDHRRAEDAVMNRAGAIAAGRCLGDCGKVLSAISARYRLGHCSDAVHGRVGVRGFCPGWIERAGSSSSPDRGSKRNPKSDRSLKAFCESV